MFLENRRISNSAMGACHCISAGIMTSEAKFILAAYVEINYFGTFDSIYSIIYSEDAFRLASHKAINLRQLFETKCEEIRSDCRRVN